ncbi:MAG: ABC transporter ATP-binding protein [Micrococcales bacterium]|nr:ABC transporter ATP-binding protein [Micrococcales bacterium]
MTDTPAVVVERLTVQRGHNRVLEDFSCEMPRGRVTGLLGPSGSGKTTLMRAIVGVQRVRSGSVRVLGEPAGSASLRRRVAYMTQAASVYSDITVAENVRFFARLVGASPRRADEVIEQVGLGGARGQLAGSVSGGQLSRVSLACALVGDPEVLVLDEPTVGQDPLLRDELWDDFRARAKAGTTVLVSSHVMDEAGRCDDLLLIREGSLLAHDTPAGVLAATGAGDLDAAFLQLVRASGPRQARSAS